MDNNSRPRGVVISYSVGKGLRHIACQKNLILVLKRDRSQWYRGHTVIPKILETITAFIESVSCFSYI